jgi:hypothetical protein
MSRRRLIEGAPPAPEQDLPGRGHDHMTKHDGQESSSNKLQHYLMSLLDKEGTP